MERKQLHVIGSGWGRTGTSSFKKALEILGFGPCYHMSEVIGNNGHASGWKKLSENPDDEELLHSLIAGSGYKSSCDAPSCFFWEQQARLYPNAKVVLTARDPEKWYKSCCDTIFQMQPSHSNSSIGVKVALWLGLPTRGIGAMLEKLIEKDFFHGDWSKENVINCYNTHNEQIVKNCPPERLLVFDVNKGWAPLCEFLEVPIPDVPYPHLNDTEHFQRIVALTAGVGYTAILVGGLLATAVISKLTVGKFVPF